VTPELEAKFHAPSDEDLARLLSDRAFCRVEPVGELAMGARYFDRPDGALRQNRMALRLRREGERTVCCLKLRGTREGAFSARPEFEAEAPSLQEGVDRLLCLSLPLEAAALLRDTSFVELCTMDFSRRRWLARTAGGIAAEISLDRGAMSGPLGARPIDELEMERKAGGENAFFSLCADLSARHGLVPLAESKFSRAAALWA